MAQMGMQAVGTALSALGNVDKNTIRGQNSTAVDKLDIKNKINKQSNGVINTNNIQFLEDKK